MTEDDAKTKWCPFARVHRTKASDEAAAAVNRPLEMMDGEAFCLGSGCMAWRWEHFAPGIDIDRFRHGFCGLAGDGGPRGMLKTADEVTATGTPF